MKHMCPNCKLEKDGVGPKVIGQDKIFDPKFNNPTLTLITKVMCNDCLELCKKEELKI